MGSCSIEEPRQSQIFGQKVLQYPCRTYIANICFPSAAHTGCVSWHESMSCTAGRESDSPSKMYPAILPQLREEIYRRCPLLKARNVHLTSRQKQIVLSPPLSTGRSTEIGYYMGYSYGTQPCCCQVDRTYYCWSTSATDHLPPTTRSSIRSCSSTRRGLPREPCSLD